MADVSIKIPVIFEGMLTNSKKIAENLVKNMEGAMSVVKGRVGESTKLVDSIAQGFNKMLVKIGILAAIWEAFSVFLRPILTMFKLIMIMLFLPLMPLVKQMLVNMKNIADNVKEAQDKATAAGGSPMDVFGAGILALAKEPSVWMLIGGLIAASFLAAVTAGIGTAVVGGLATITLGLGIMALAEWINKEDFASQLGIIGLGGLAAFILTLLKTGKLAGAILNAKIAIAAGLTIAFIIEAYDILTQDGTSVLEYFKLMATGAGAGALIGFMAGGPEGALVGGTIGISVSLLISLLDVAWEAGWDIKMIELFQKSKNWLVNVWTKIFHGKSIKEFEKPSFVSALTLEESAELSKKAFGEKEDFEDFYTPLKTSLDTVSESLKNVKTTYTITTSTMKTDLPVVTKNVTALNTSIGGTSLGIGGTSSLINNLNTAKTTYVNISSTMKTDLPIIKNKVDDLSLSIKGPLVNNLNYAINRFITMKNTGVDMVNQILDSLSKLNRTYTTIHKIKTVYV